MITSHGAFEFKSMNRMSLSLSLKSRCCIFCYTEFLPSGQGRDILLLIMREVG